MLRSLALIAVTAVATFAATKYFEPSRQARTVEPMSVTPRWVEETCLQMTADERERDELAVHVLRTVKLSSWMRIGAVRDLGLEQHRTVEKHPRRVCPRDDLNDEIASITVAARMFASSYLHADTTWLARRLGPRDSSIAQALAGTAFRQFPIETSSPELRRDIRSLARTALAEFGDAASPWRDQAFAATDTKDALGTGAAQIAVAAGHPDALTKVSALLDGILRAQSKDPIGHDARNRFYELAYALAAAGPKARPFADPVIRIMSRKVQSFAPPFGMIELPPRRMCRVLEIIGGPDAERARSGDVCHPDIDVFEK